MVQRYTRCARCPHRVAARADAITTFAAATKGTKCKAFVRSRQAVSREAVRAVRVRKNFNLLRTHVGSLLNSC